MPKFNPEPCTVVGVKGSEITIVTKDGTTFRRNISFCKKIPKHLEIEGEDDDTDILVNNPVPTPNEVDSPDDIEREQNEPMVVRRSTRSRCEPQRFGEPIPTDLVIESD